jgi:outer membrane protein assembly factor BamB
VTIGGAKHNVVYVATSHNMVYAFDADMMAAPLWSKQLEMPVAPAIVHGGCGDMQDTEVGITSTPVIDPNEGPNGTIYVVARTNGAANLHALDLTTGMDAAGSPAPMGVGVALFVANSELQRPGLLLQNGVIFVGFGSNCDAGGYHGFILAHDQHTLKPLASYCTTPTGGLGAIWQSGMGLGGDGTGVWEVVANGNGGDAWTVSRLTLSGSMLTVGTTHTQNEGGDNDLAAGPVLIGGQVIAGGKNGAFFNVSASTGALGTSLSVGGSLHNIAAWDGGPAGMFVYAAAAGGSIRQYTLAGGMMTLKGTAPGPAGGYPGPMIEISSNGTMPGTAIAWANIAACNAWKAHCGGSLVAWDASDVTKGKLWQSGDTHTYAKFSPPMIANGKVYVASWDPSLIVYGL